ncbi:hypothetical protein GCM10022240_22570 [Microbacterium kribbense]|uniref:DUF3099 domain-containing protein n=1 Tax=Microbacterium kribbense TaxID=433645 RepID=A0ABP7GN30_9MICO
MKTSAEHQSATSLPRAPRDDVSSRSTRYLIMMGVRVLCFLLMVFVQPFGWYTWIFGVGAIFLPYIAVVLANAGGESNTVGVVPPERALEAPHAAAAPGRPEGGHEVIRVAETHTAAAGGARAASSRPGMPDDGK